jgi:hypothetical protein
VKAAGLGIVAWFLVCPSAAAQSRIPTVSICALARNPSHYHGKTVRVRAILSRGIEYVGLEDDKAPSCAFINLSTEAISNDEETRRFLRLADEEVVPTSASYQQEALTHMMIVLGYLPGDKDASPPQPCTFLVCSGCFRYEPVIATFTGKFRYSKKEPGGCGFGHLNLQKFQLDVISVSDVEATDVFGTKYDKRCWKVSEPE